MAETPEWVLVGRELMMKQCRAYQAETGRTPSRALLEAFMRAGREALEHHLQDPSGIPYQAMTLAEFERSGQCWG